MEANNDCSIQYFIQTEPTPNLLDDKGLQTPPGSLWLTDHDSKHLKLGTREVQPPSKTSDPLATNTAQPRNTSNPTLCLENICEYRTKLTQINENAFFFLLGIPKEEIRHYFHSNVQLLEEGLKIKKGTHVIILPDIKDYRLESMDKHYNSATMNTGCMTGVVHYVGTTSKWNSTTFGIELDSEFKGNGTSQGEFHKTKYFSCEDNDGMFCGGHRILPLKHDTKSNTLSIKQNNTSTQENETSMQENDTSIKKNDIRGLPLQQSMCNIDVFKSSTAKANCTDALPPTKNLHEGKIVLPHEESECQLLNEHREEISNKQNEQENKALNEKNEPIHNIDNNSGATGDSKISCELLMKDSDSCSNIETASNAKNNSSQLAIGDRVIHFTDSAGSNHINCEYGTVKWIGYLPDARVKDEFHLMAGVEFDNPKVGKGSGQYHGVELFAAKKGHAGLIPVMGLARAEEFESTK